MDKTTLIYAAGCYGEFVFRFLNQFKTIPMLSYKASTEPARYTKKYRGDHHLIREEDVNGHVTKITYDNSDVDLINRNKWTKVKGHLVEQSDKTYPKNKNRQVYIMAIYKCFLLDKDNHFKKIYKQGNTEIKFSWLSENVNQWIEHFSKIFDTLQICVKEKTIIEFHDIFHESQKKTIEEHRTSKDMVYLSNKLGQVYFQKYGNNFSEDRFDEIYLNMGA